MALGQLVLDGLLMGQEPVHGLVEFLYLHGPQVQGLTQSGIANLTQFSGQCQLASRIEHPAHDHGHGQIPLSAAASQE